MKARLIRDLVGVILSPPTNDILIRGVWVEADKITISPFAKPSDNDYKIEMSYNGTKTATVFTSGDSIMELGEHAFHFREVKPNDTTCATGIPDYI